MSTFGAATKADNGVMMNTLLAPKIEQNTNNTVPSTIKQKKTHDQIRVDWLSRMAPPVLYFHPVVVAEGESKASAFSLSRCNAFQYLDTLLGGTHVHYTTNTPLGDLDRERLVCRRSMKVVALLMARFKRFYTSSSAMNPTVSSSSFYKFGNGHGFIRSTRVQSQTGSPAAVLSSTTRGSRVLLSRIVNQQVAHLPLTTLMKAIEEASFSLMPYPVDPEDQDLPPARDGLALATFTRRLSHYWCHELTGDGRTSIISSERKSLLNTLQSGNSVGLSMDSSNSTTQNVNSKKQRSNGITGVATTTNTTHINTLSVLPPAWQSIMCMCIACKARVFTLNDLLLALAHCYIDELDRLLQQGQKQKTGNKTSPTLNHNSIESQFAHPGLMQRALLYKWLATYAESLLTSDAQKHNKHRSNRKQRITKRRITPTLNSSFINRAYRQAYHTAKSMFATAREMVAEFHQRRLQKVTDTMTGAISTKSTDNPQRRRRLLRNRCKAVNSKFLPVCPDCKCTMQPDFSTDSDTTSPSASYGEEGNDDLDYLLDEDPIDEDDKDLDGEDDFFVDEEGEQGFFEDEFDEADNFYYDNDADFVDEEDDEGSFDEDGGEATLDRGKKKIASPRTLGTNSGDEEQLLFGRDGLNMRTTMVTAGGFPFPDYQRRRQPLSNTSNTKSKSPVNTMTAQNSSVIPSTVHPLELSFRASAASCSLELSDTIECWKDPDLKSKAITTGLAFVPVCPYPLSDDIRNINLQIEVSSTENIEHLCLQGQRIFQLFVSELFQCRLVREYQEHIVKKRQAELLAELEAGDTITEERSKKISQQPKTKGKKKVTQQSKQQKTEKLHAQPVIESKRVELKTKQSTLSALEPISPLATPIIEESDGKEEIDISSSEVEIIKEEEVETHVLEEEIFISEKDTQKVESDDDTLTAQSEIADVGDTEGDLDINQVLLSALNIDDITNNAPATISTPYSRFHSLFSSKQLPGINNNEFNVKLNSAPPGLQPTQPASVFLSTSPSHSNLNVPSNFLLGSSIWSTTGGLFGPSLLVGNKQQEQTSVNRSPPPPPPGLGKPKASFL